MNDNNRLFVLLLVIVSFGLPLHLTADSQAERLLKEPGNSDESSDSRHDMDEDESCVSEIMATIVRQLKPVSGVTIVPDEAADAANSEVLRYMEGMRSKIAASPSLTAPQADSREKQVVISFRVHASGELSDVRFEKTSSHMRNMPFPYDEVGKQAIELAAPFRAFPPSLNAKWIDGTATIFYPSQESIKDRERAKAHTANVCRELAQIELSIPATTVSPSGLATLEALRGQLKKYEHELGADFRVSMLRRSLMDRTNEIKEKLASDAKLQQFDTACESTIRKASFPRHLRDEPVSSSRNETKTLGRAFCTAINGGGMVEFRVIDEKTPTVGIFVKTTKRRFVVILQKKMKADLSEEWTAVEVQTPSDRKPVPSFLGYSFMDGFPELVRNE